MIALRYMTDTCCMILSLLLLLLRKIGRNEQKREQNEWKRKLKQARDSLVKTDMKHVNGK